MCLARVGTELMAAGSAFVLGLFHTLVDTEHLRPRGFHEVAAVAEVCGVDRDRFSAFWSATCVAPSGAQVQARR